jgi:uncharacterized protein YjiS (DUF1127 family)
MSKSYFATIVAVFITTSLATNLLLIGARGGTALGLPARQRFRPRRLSRRMWRFIDSRLDAMITRRERHATSAALRLLDDRQLGDLGLYRDCVGNISDTYADIRGETSISKPAKGR